MDEYRTKYEEREPDSSKIRNNDERMLLSEEHGVKHINNSPMSDTDIVYGTPPKTRENGKSDTTKYIWVICNSIVPTILEKSEKVNFLEISCYR